MTLIDRELSQVAERIAELTGLRTELTNLRARWAERDDAYPEAACICPIIEEQQELA